MKKLFSIILLSISLIFCLSGCFLFDEFLGDDSEFVDNYSTSIPYINETLVNIYGIEFEVTEVTNHSSLSNGYLTITPEAHDANFVWVTIEIYNGSNKTFNINPFNFKLWKMTSDGYLSYNHSSYTYNLPDYMTATELGPSLKKTFNILFEVPSKTTEDEYRLFCDPIKYSLNAPDGSVNVIILKDR